MKNRFATRLAAVSLTITLPLTALPAVQAEEISTPAAVVSTDAEFTQPTTDKPAVDSVGEPVILDAEDADGELVQPTALPFVVIRCLAGLSIRGQQLLQIAELATTGNWAAIGTLFGTAALACVRGR